MNLVNRLEDWFPKEGHRFYMRFERGSIADYFKGAGDNSRTLRERRQWLRSAPELYSAFLPEAAALLEETLQIARTENALIPDELTMLRAISSPLEQCRLLGELWEPDFVLLRSESSGEFRVVAGCVCFPSSWSLAEKIGQPMEAVHGPVPGLNAMLGKRINSFLAKMKPGVAWQRLNWSLSRSAELNQHPDRPLPQLNSATSPDEIFLRLEDQALVKLPKTQGVLFGIRITGLPLRDVKLNRTIAEGLALFLKTMSEPVAAYKKLAAVRQTVVCFLES